MQQLKGQTVVVGFLFILLIVGMKRAETINNQTQQPYQQQYSAVMRTQQTLTDQTTAANPVDDAINTAFGDLGPSVIAEAYLVAECESSLKPDAHRTNVNPAVMMGDLGLFQINHVNHQRVHAYNPESLFDPHVNAQAARQLYDEAGGSWKDWGRPGTPWGTYRCHGLS